MELCYIDRARLPAAAALSGWAPSRLAEAVRCDDPPWRVLGCLTPCGRLAGVMVLTLAPEEYVVDLLAVDEERGEDERDAARRALLTDVERRMEASFRRKAITATVKDGDWPSLAFFQAAGFSAKLDRGRETWTCKRAAE